MFESKNVKAKRKALFMVSGLLLVFILPMLLAQYLFHHPTVLSGHTNRGQLINPPLPLAQLPLMDMEGHAFNTPSVLKKWTLLYVSGLPCDDACQQNIYKLRQIRIATGKERERINRMFLIVANEPIAASQQKFLTNMIASRYAGTVVGVGKPALFNDIFKPEQFYLIDPLGNIMLSYPAGVKPGDIFKDLEHVLKISQIG